MKLKSGITCNEPWTPAGQQSGHPLGTEGNSEIDDSETSEDMTTMRA